MKIQFFNAPVWHYSGAPNHLENPALGMPTLAAVLELEGHLAEVYDLEALRRLPESLQSAFAGQKQAWPDVVGFTTTYHNRRGVKECIAALRAAGFDRYIVVGGPQATLDPYWFLETREHAGADAAVMGECEGNICEIVCDQPEGVVAGKQMDIDKIPGPLWARHVPKPRDYAGNMPKVGHPEGIAMATRGCPHRCIFCSNTVFRRQKIRFRPLSNLRTDLLELRDVWDCKSVFLYDDEIIGAGAKQNSWAMHFADTVSDLGLTFKGQGRCSRLITPDAIKALHRAGFRAMMWGVESFSDRVLLAMQKDTTPLDIWHTLRVSKENGLRNWLFLMVGNYSETQGDLWQTWCNLREAKRQGLVDWAQVTVCTPMPGTLLWQRAAEEGWLVKPPEDGVQMTQVFGGTKSLTAKEIAYWQERLRGV